MDYGYIHVVIIQTKKKYVNLITCYGLCYGFQNDRYLTAKYSKKKKFSFSGVFWIEKKEPLHQFITDSYQRVNDNHFYCIVIIILQL